jgi:outer membrane protein assembly factor BamB
MGGFAWWNTHTFAAEWEFPNSTFFGTTPFCLSVGPTFSPRDDVVVAYGIVQNTFGMTVALNATDGAPLWNVTGVTPTTHLLAVLSDDGMVVLVNYSPVQTGPAVFTVYDLPTDTPLYNFTYPMGPNGRTLSGIGRGEYVYVVVSQGGMPADGRGQHPGLLHCQRQRGECDKSTRPRVRRGCVHQLTGVRLVIIDPGLSLCVV